MVTGLKGEGGRGTVEGFAGVSAGGFAGVPVLAVWALDCLGKVGIDIRTRGHTRVDSGSEV